MGILICLQAQLCEPFSLSLLAFASLLRSCYTHVTIMLYYASKRLTLSITVCTQLPKGKLLLLRYISPAQVCIHLLCDPCTVLAAHFLCSGLHITAAQRKQYSISFTIYFIPCHHELDNTISHKPLDTIGFRKTVMKSITAKIIKGSNRIKYSLLSANGKGSLKENLLLI